MIALDTNILIRLITNDDPRQTTRAKTLLAKNQIFIPKTVFLEMEWVLRHAYLLDRDTIQNAFEIILGLPNVEVETVTEIATALEWYQQGLDFADALHLASSKIAEQLATFDEKLSKKAKQLGTTPLVLLA